MPKLLKWQELWASTPKILKVNISETWKRGSPNHRKNIIFTIQHHQLPIPISLHTLPSTTKPTHHITPTSTKKQRSTSLTQAITHKIRIPRNQMSPPHPLNSNPISLIFPKFKSLKNSSTSCSKQLNPSYKIPTNVNENPHNSKTHSKLPQMKID